MSCGHFFRLAEVEQVVLVVGCTVPEAKVHDNFL